MRTAGRSCSPRRATSKSSKASVPFPLRAIEPGPAEPDEWAVGLQGGRDAVVLQRLVGMAGEVLEISQEVLIPVIVPSKRTACRIQAIDRPIWPSGKWSRAHSNAASAERSDPTSRGSPLEIRPGRGSRRDIVAAAGARAGRAGPATAPSPRRRPARGRRPPARRRGSHAPGSVAPSSPGPARSGDRRSTTAFTQRNSSSLTSSLSWPPRSWSSMPKGYSSLVQSGDFRT